MAKKPVRDYLHQKAGESVWYVSIKIPPDVKQHFEYKTKLTKTTGTSDRAKAREVSYSILAKWKQCIRNARQLRPEAPDQWREILAEEAREWQKELDRLYASAGRSDSEDEVFQPRALAKEFEETHIATILKVLSEQAGLTEAELKEASGIMRSPSSYKPRSPITKSMIDQWCTYLESQIDNKKTIDTHIGRITRFSHWLSSEGKELVFDDVHDFLDSVSQSASTRKNYLWSGRDFWKWGCKYHPEFRERFKDKVNPFDNHVQPKTGKSGTQSYTPFTREEVEKLHAKALSDNNYSLANLIEFGAYTGCRLEEIGRIRIETTEFDGNNQPISFKVDDSKTKAGIRTIPIHSLLQPLYSQLLEQSKDGYLFVGGNNKYNNRLDYLSKQFGRLKKSEGFGSKHVFHSVRKTVATQLEQAGVSALVIPAILGHETGLITFDIYSAGASMKQKTEAIEKLQYNFKED